MSRPYFLKGLFLSGCLIAAIGQGACASPGIRTIAAEPGGWIWANPTPQGNDLFAVARIDDQNAYAIGAAGTLIRLENGGRTATFLDTANVYRTFHDINFLSSGEAWALSGDTVFRTSDGGLTWVDQKVPSRSPQLQQMKFIDNRTGFISARKGYFFRTTDGGATWQAVTYDTSPGIDCIGLDFVDASQGWQACSDGILATTNGGVTWRLVSTDPVAPDALKLVFIDRLNGWLVTTRAIARTRDGGRTWTKTSVGSGNLWGLYMRKDGSGRFRGWAVGERGEIFATSDGDTWTAQSSGTTFILRDVEFSSDFQHGWIVGDRGTVLTTSDGGSTWAAQKQSPVASVPLGTPRLAGVAFSEDETIGYAVGEQGLILKTEDGGVSWTKLASGTGARLNAVAVHRTHPDLAWAVGDSATTLWTADGGKTWNASDIRLTGATVRDVHFLDEKRGLAVGEVPVPRGTPLGAIWETDDGGRSWSVVRLPFLLASPFYGIHLNDSGTGVAVGQGGMIYQTADRGSTWEYVSGLRNRENLYGAYMRADGRGWAVGAHGTILETTDGGSSWSVVQTGQYYNLRSVAGREDRVEALAVGTEYANEVWFGSTMGTIVKLGGTGWHAQRSRTYGPLSRVRFFDTNHAWAVGDEASILRSWTGGEE